MRSELDCRWSTVFLFAMSIVCLGTAPALARQASAKPEPPAVFQYDDIVYSLPEHWSKGRTNTDHVVLYTRKRKGPMVTVRIYQSGERTRAPKKWHSEMVKRSLDKDDGEPIKSFEEKVTRVGGKQTVLSVQLHDRKLFAFATIATRARTHFLRFDIRCRNGDRDDLVEALKALQDEFAPFCDSLKFVSTGARPLIGKPNAGPLAGIYYGTTHGITLDGSMKMGLEFYVFDKSGRFYHGLPAGEAANRLDFKKAIKTAPDDAGNYYIEEDQVVLRYADGDRETEKFEIQNGTYKIGSFNLAKVPADGKVYEGLYVDFNYSGFTPGAGVTGGVVSQRTFRFQSSGRFSATRFGAASGNFESGGTTTGGFSTSSERPEVRGTYEVKNGTIRLTDDKNQVTICSVVEVGDGLLFVDGRQYLRKDRNRSSKPTEPTKRQPR